MKIEIVIPEKVLISKDCKLITLPGNEGMIEIMSGHESMIIELTKGEIIIDSQEKIKISSGFAVVEEMSCKVVVNEAQK
jgi:F-type H+-transporting ATPase subunit epsilon